MPHPQTDKEKRASREAITIARVLARQWRQEMFVWRRYRPTQVRYVVREEACPRRRHDRNAYRVTPAGEVFPNKGFVVADEQEVGHGPRE